MSSSMPVRWPLNGLKNILKYAEVKNAISLVGDLIVTHLKANAGLKNMGLRIHDEIQLTVQLIIDELEDSYDRLTWYRLIGVPDI